MAEFHETKMGRQFYDRTMPDLVKAIERLARRTTPVADPALEALIHDARDLCVAVDDLLEIEIQPGSRATWQAFQRVRANAAAVREALAKLPSPNEE